MSSNRKVYARQVPWEWQESPWDDEQLKIDKAALYGNRSYGRYVFDEFEQVVKALEEMMSIMVSLLAANKREQARELAVAWRA